MRLLRSPGTSTSRSGAVAAVELERDRRSAIPLATLMTVEPRCGALGAAVAEFEMRGLLAMRVSGLDEHGRGAAPICCVPPV